MAKVPGGSPHSKAGPLPEGVGIGDNHGPIFDKDPKVALSGEARKPYHEQGAALGKLSEQPRGSGISKDFSGI